MAVTVIPDALARVGTAVDPVTIVLWGVSDGGFRTRGRHAVDITRGEATLPRL